MTVPTWAAVLAALAVPAVTAGTAGQRFAAEVACHGSALGQPNACIRARNDRSVEFALRIDQRAWTRPVGEASAAAVRFGSRDSLPICGSWYLDKNPFASVSHHQICGEFITFAPQLPASLDEQMLLFVAAHESFHTLVQMQFGRSRIDSFEPFSRLDSAQAIAEANSMLLDWIADRSPHAGPEVCDRLHSDLSRASQASRDVLLSLVHSEGPAEHYAREYLRNRGKSDGYAEMREAIELLSFRASRQIPGASDDSSLLPEGGMIYSTAADLVESIELGMPRDQWQERYRHGSTLVDLYLESRHCSQFFGRTVMTRAVRLPSLQAVGLAGR